MDDGAATFEDSVAIARAAAEDGVSVLAATPHVRDDFPTDASTMERLLRETREAVEAAGIGIELVPGGEIAIGMLDELGDGDLRRFGLGGNPRWLLVEFPYHGWPLALRQIVFDLRARGFVPLLAHPERNSEVQADPQRLEGLVQGGAYVQLTAASMDGRLGRRTQSTARKLLDLGFAHVLASDAHTPAIRAAGMRAACEAVGDGGLARWLSESVPAAILADEPLPERPRLLSSRRSRLPWKR